MQERKTLTVLEIQNLMLETLEYKEEDIDSEGKTFYKYGYQGTQDDLFRLMESLAVKKGLIEERVKLKPAAWGGCGYILHPGCSTNFNRDELKKIYEVFYILLNRGIIAPGAIGNYGPNLPNFHVTEYGFKCLHETDILPYDNEGYLNKLSEIENLDKWIKFYIEQSLECFNSYCYEAALIMVGLANEVIMENLINNYLNYLKIKDPTKESDMKEKINSSMPISAKYLKYQTSLKESMRSDSKLKELSKYLDQLANDTFMSYVRLTRNELSHPSEIKTDRITALMIFASFTNYCKRQYIFINYFEANSIPH